MEKLVKQLQRDNPNLVFTVGEANCWSPQHNQILYAATDEQRDIAGLLHELGHARLGHQSFTTDVDLLQKEVDAWQEAVRLAERYGLTLDESRMQDCLDTYRDWLYRRSRCPACQATGVQQTARRYVCVNCGGSWEVSSSRLKRPYRQKALAHKK